MNTRHLAFPLEAPESEQIDFLLHILGLSCPPDSARIKRLTGGITNSVLLFSTPQLKAIVRVNGNNTEQIIDRQNEVDNLQTINFITIYHKLLNGMVCSYQPGRAIDFPMMAEPEIYYSVAELLGKMHRITLGHNTRSNSVFDKIRTFIDKLDPAELDSIDLSHLNTLLNRMESKLTNVLDNSTIALCHNDLLSGNILWDGSSVHFLDYEYSGYTWAEYDIANHFFEWCGFVCDLGRFPTVEQQCSFLKKYLFNLYGRTPSNVLVDQWQRRVAALVPLTHLYWGVWAMFQAMNSDNDFPYLEYGKKRLMLMDYTLPLPDGHSLLGKPLMEHS